jgi:hypothetical protein
VLEGTLNQIFKRITTGEKVEAQFTDKQEYESARTGLLRKFRKDVEAFTKCGFPSPMEGKYLKCSWDGGELSGSFELADEARKAHAGKSKVYGMKDV